MANVSLISYKTGRNEYPIGHSLASMRLASFVSMDKKVRARLASFSMEQDAREIARAVASQKPDIVGLTAYNWTVGKTIEVAHAAKEAMPSAAIVVGGPELYEPSLVNHGAWPEGTIFVSGEGEEPLRWLCTEIGKGGKFEVGEGRPRGVYTAKFASARPSVMKELGGYVPLFSEGFTGMLDSNVSSDFMWWETARGCRYRCAFCGHKTTNVIRAFDHGLLSDELRNFSARGIKRVYITDPSLGGTTKGGKDVLRMLSEFAPEIAINCYIRAELLDGEFIKMLGDANTDRIKLGIQTINPAVPKWIRNNNIEKMHSVAEKLRNAGITWHIDLLVGLPGDDMEGLRETFKFVVDELKPSVIRAYRLSILVNTMLYRILDATEEKYWVKADGKGRAKESNSYAPAEMEAMLAYATAMASLYPLLPREKREFAFMEGLVGKLVSGMDRELRTALVGQDHEYVEARWGGITGAGLG